ncbi:substrate-binding domain-containing protein [Telluribacter sp.]|jgi:phosphate transport system substrate-binding protein|uniref:PstS family phosphate ABC transporter substrate-binding protein n=1 Tax=Telluribacter sp. TaxID=1978767 RepID=UPI002E12ECF6|nr:substrate-binding domain-containing protein [Telluribacter sp.]
MKRGSSLGIASVLISIFIWTGCTSDSSLDNPRQGTITVAADESFRPVVSALTRAYEGIYPEAHFNVLYRPEQEAILALLQDSARLAIVTRELTVKERDIIRKQEGAHRVQHIAIDGIALITSKANSDSLITMPELEGIFNGTLTDWSGLKDSNQSGKITLVFDDANSSNLGYMLKHFNVEDVTKLRIFTAGNNEKVIDYVRKNPQSIGFIGVNWISDGDESITYELSKGIHVLGVSDKAEPASIADYYQPFQRDLGRRKYPLSRKLYIISREGFAGLGGGLMTYIARDVGGLIIQKMGLIPAIPYPREIELRSEQNF